MRRHNKIDGAIIILALVTVILTGCFSPAPVSYRVYGNQCKEWSFGGPNGSIQYGFLKTKPDMDTFYDFYVCTNSTRHHRHVSPNYFRENPSEAAATITRKIGNARADFEVLLVSLVLMNMHFDGIYNVRADKELMREWRLAISKMNEKSWFRDTSAEYYNSVVDAKWGTVLFPAGQQAPGTPGS